MFNPIEFKLKILNKCYVCIWWCVGYIQNLIRFVILLQFHLLVWVFVVAWISLFFSECRISFGWYSLNFKPLCAHSVHYESILHLHISDDIFLYTAGTHIFFLYFTRVEFFFDLRAIRLRSTVLKYRNHYYVSCYWYAIYYAVIECIIQKSSR